MKKLVVDWSVHEKWRRRELSTSEYMVWFFEHLERVLKELTDIKPGRRFVAVEAALGDHLGNDHVMRYSYLLQYFEIFQRLDIPVVRGGTHGFRTYWHEVEGDHKEEAFVRGSLQEEARKLNLDPSSVVALSDHHVFSYPRFYKRDRVLKGLNGHISVCRCCLFDRDRGKSSTLVRFCRRKCISTEGT